MDPSLQQDHSTSVHQLLPKSIRSDCLENTKWSSISQFSKVQQGYSSANICSSDAETKKLNKSARKQAHRRTCSDIVLRRHYNASPPRGERRRRRRDSGQETGGEELHGSPPPGDDTGEAARDASLPRRMRRSRRGEPVAVEGSRRQARGSHGGVRRGEG